jgi:hypothetical protein
LGTLALLQVGDWPKVQTGETKYVPFRDVRIFAGQADAENSARFSIDYVFLGTKHHVVGELKPDDTVAFSDTLQ